MRIGGIQKLTLIDYPGKLACAVFIAGCNFRCPFCHNPDLVVPSRELQIIPEKEFFYFLKKRIRKIDGVCVSGGEPLMQSDIIDFVKKIKNLNYFVKLDTNGYFPDVLQKLIDQKIIDYIAMDIKHQPKHYHRAVGVHVNIDIIQKSVSLIMKSGVDYEFRTTAVPGIHLEEDFIEIGKWLNGAKVLYLQKYNEIKIFDPKLKDITRGKTLNLNSIAKKLAKYFGKVGIR